MMELEKSLQKAEHLLNQDRFGEAQTEIKNYLTANPENLDGLIILAQTHLGLNQDEQADQVVDDLIKLAPSNPYILYLKGITQTQLGKRKSALKLLNSALSFNPMLVEAHAIKSMIYFEEAQFEEAVAAANEGLAIDAQNETCLNQLSRALLKLGREDERIEADKQALKNNPMNPNTHATVGFSELEKGNIKKAKEHFREALRLDPNNEFARNGMLHAIKSTNLYYRLFLKYIFWMQSLRPNVRWAVIIIGYLMIRGLDTISESLGSLAPIAGIFVWLYVIFAVSTWIIGPVSNLFLRFNAFGKYMLKESEIKTANITASLLTFSLVGGVIMLMAESDIVLYNIGLYSLCAGIAMTIVFSAIENSVLEKSKRNLKTAGLIFGIGWIALILSGIVLPALALKMFTWLIYGFLGFQFYANSQQ